MSTIPPYAPITLGLHLKQMRESAKLSQATLAARVSEFTGMQQWIIARWERNKLVPDAGQLEALLDALDATEDQRTAARHFAKERVRRSVSDSLVQAA